MASQCPGNCRKMWVQRFAMMLRWGVIIVCSLYFCIPAFATLIWLGATHSFVVFSIMPMLVQILLLLGVKNKTPKPLFIYYMIFFAVLAISHVYAECLIDLGQDVCGRSYNSFWSSLFVLSTFPAISAIQYIVLFKLDKKIEEGR